MHHPPQGVSYDVVLLLHVGCVVVALAAVTTSAATAARVRKVLVAKAILPDSVVRYFRPGVNWAGRTVFGIPVFGFALLAMSRGAFALRDGWILGGFAIFVAAALLTEGALWPAERRLQRSLLPYREGGATAAPDVSRDARVMELSAGATLVLLVAGSVLMVAQP
ncbi:MAG TPA: hypothetical protein VNG12_18080 [Acidimicrobiales bacterium]|nr:hypothetical protein [Acidimicrobiales bacterium]